VGGSSPNDARDSSKRVLEREGRTLKDRGRCEKVCARMIVGVDARVALARGRGWGRYGAELIRALAHRRDLELRILLPSGTVADRLVEDLPRSVAAQCAPCTLPASGGTLSETLRLDDPARFLGNIDLLHSLTRFVARTEVRPVVATVHDVAPLSTPPFKIETRSATLRALERLDELDAEVIAISRFTRKELVAAGFPRDRAHVVPQGVRADLLTLGDRAQEARGKRYVLFVGGAGSNKNLVRLVDAMRRVRQRVDVELVLVGSRTWGYDELRAELREDRGASPGWLHHLDSVSDEMLIEIYRGAAVFVLPSLHEGFGLPLLEAMALRIPVACSRIEVFEEIVGDAAVTFDPRDLEEMAFVIVRVLENPDLARRLVEAGGSRAARLTWQATAAGTVDVYRRALRKRATAERAVGSRGAVS
jgi:glycosyltransferase involved in cell wall biosynthesis